MKAFLIAIFLCSILSTLASAMDAPLPASTSDSAWPEPGNPVPPYDK